MTKECCEWTGELYDDSLKEMFRADEAYSNGNKAKAIAYLKGQAEKRLPLIEHKAKSVCDDLKDNPTKMLQADLEEIANDMIKEMPYKKVHDKIMKTDKKYAVRGYEAFCLCQSKE